MTTMQRKLLISEFGEYLNANLLIRWGVTETEDESPCVACFGTDPNETGTALFVGTEEQCEECCEAIGQWFIEVHAIAGTAVEVNKNSVFDIRVWKKDKGYDNEVATGLAEEAACSGIRPYQA